MVLRTKFWFFFNDSKVQIELRILDKFMKFNVGRNNRGFLYKFKLVYYYKCENNKKSLLINKKTRAKLTNILLITI